MKHKIKKSKRTWIGAIGTKTWDERRGFWKQKMRFIFIIYYKLMVRNGHPNHHITKVKYTFIK